MYAGRAIPVSDEFADSIRRALEALGTLQVQGTFFVVAEHAAQAPDAVREVVAHGHEVASHAWTHLMVNAFTPGSLREDLARSAGTLEDITGQKVRGHRSPLFSLLPEHVWALEVMAELGLEYDSSIATLPWHRAGLQIPEGPFGFVLPSGREIIEFPVPSRKIGPVQIRLIGGRGARLAPMSLSLDHIRRCEEAGTPAMLYVHTYEIVPDNLAKYVPRSIGWKRLPIVLSARAFQLGLGRLNRLVRHLLSNYSWAPAYEVICQLRDQGKLPTFELRGK
jgi:peptidoglycan/xylan/chitin deacetylase (PgdA/CDA1 family)